MGEERVILANEKNLPHSPPHSFIHSQIHTRITKIIPLLPPAGRARKHIILESTISSQSLLIKGKQAIPLQFS